jgi:hypothetical protein
VIDHDATLGEKLFEVPVRQPVPEVPAHRQQDHLGRESETSEPRGHPHRWSRTASALHPATLTATVRCVNATEPLTVGRIADDAVSLAINWIMPGLIQDSHEALLSPSRRVLLVAVGISLLALSAPLLGFKQAMGALLAGLASLLLTVALVEAWVHKRQQRIEQAADAPRVKALAASIGRDLLLIAGVPLECFAPVLPDWYGRSAPAQADAPALLGLAAELREHFTRVETRALAMSDGWVAPTSTDEELEALGLPNRERMKWIADNVAENLRGYEDLPLRMLVAGIGDPLESLARLLIADLRREWHGLADQGGDYPTSSAFLRLAATSLDITTAVLGHLAQLPLDQQPTLKPAPRQDLAFTTWERVQAWSEHDNPS